jgi:CMP-N,N'-diacetyllegionaminic acid synthase
VYTQLSEMQKVYSEPAATHDENKRKNMLCVVPARSGSQAVKHKNIRDFLGKPLLAHSISQVRQSKHFDNMRIIVSTDSERYAAIARNYGAECPFLRPPELSGPLSTDVDCMQHCLQWLKEQENYVPDFVLHLRPTQPLRLIADIDTCIDIFKNKRHMYDSLRSVVEVDKSPFKMYTVKLEENADEGPTLRPLFPELDGLHEPFNNARQLLPRAYLHNGYIDIVNTEVLNKGFMSGEKIFPHIMKKEDTVDIDTEEDWVHAEEIARKANKRRSENMVRRSGIEQAHTQ